ncbi:CocE/NonD family hydrolase [Candidatus Palauibacter sp.]|uniref:CocE/NonD family hydrolase n=1 Tax=Candidatus Palauibacter sp. TaxID=3101350 RepID=UPI003B01309E
MRRLTTMFAPILVPVLFVACAPEPGADDGSAPAAGADAGDAPARVSEFGRYEGYSEPRYDGWVTTSRYVEMRDGVRLAVEVTRPALGGMPESEPLPVVWTHSRYHRNPGQIVSVLAPDLDPPPDIRSQVDANEDLQRLVLHGYVVAAAGVRGSGASFGRYEGLFSEVETADAIELIEWLASQPWSDGNVGMYGGSYLGITQYMAASGRPPALKAIFPDVAALDMYELMYPGGVYRDDLIQQWGVLTREFDTTIPAPPVDGDVEGVLLRQAMEEHKDNWDVIEQYGAVRYRDQATSEHAWERHGPSGVLEDILEARVPAYHWNGWYDIFVTDATLWFANYRGPQKLGIGAWPHAGMPDPELMAERIELYAVEQHRWFDYWLKGIDNGVLDEAPIHYAVMNDPGDWRWVSAEAWPPETTSRRLYFASGASGSVASVNDGGLSSDAPASEAAFDEYEVDLTTTTGTTSRWDNAVGAAPEMIYPDLTGTDARSLTYTTPPLESDLTVTGHPVVTLWVTSSTRDADFFVLLEEVDPTGFSRYVTEGVLRASHRALEQAPWDNLGLPFHRSYERDVEPLPDAPTELRLDLHPTSTVFNAGHRLRLTVMGADRDNAEEVSEDPPTVRVYRSASHPSSVELPIAQGSAPRS